MKLAIIPIYIFPETKNKNNFSIEVGLAMGIWRWEIPVLLIEIVSIVYYTDYVCIMHTYIALDYEVAISDGIIKEQLKSQHATRQ